MTKRIFVSIACVFCLGASAHAGTVGGNGGATEITQLMNNTELMIQVEQQIVMVEQGIKQVTQMVTDAEKYVSDALGITEAVGVYNRVLGQVEKVQALAYGVQGVAAKFQAIHPDFSSLKWYDAKGYVNRTKNTMQAIKNAVDAGGALLGRARDEQQRVDALGQMVSTADGKMKALQTANAVQYEVLQQLRDTKIYTQQVNEAQMAYLASSQSDKDEKRAAASRAFDAVRGTRVID